MAETQYVKVTTKYGLEEYIALPTGGVAAHNQAWSTITDTPTTLAGYGITDSAITYPSAGIALSTGSAWAASITDNSANWNAAYGWGNHASAGYAPTANPTFTGTVTVGTKLNVNTPSKTTRDVNVGANGIYTDGNIELALDKYFFIGPTADVGNRFKLFTNGGHAYFDYYDELRFRSGASSSDTKIVFKSSGEVQLQTGGLHIGGTTDAGDNNLIVDGTLTQTGVATFVDHLTSDDWSDAGFAGQGWKMEQDTDSSLTIDNLTVRKLLKVYEMEIDKIKSVNGGIIISAANGKAEDVIASGSNVFTTWYNVVFWDVLTVNGLEITEATEDSNTPYAQVGTSTSAASIKLGIGNTITVTCTYHRVSGANQLYLQINSDLAGSAIVDTALSEGVNVITYTNNEGIIDTGVTVQIRSVGAGTGSYTLSSVSITTDHSYIVFDEDAGNKLIQFEADDYITAQEWTGRGVDSYLGKVLDVVHDNDLGQAYIIVDDITGTPWTGAELVQVGNSSDTDRQNLIYLTAYDTNNPYIAILTGVDDGDIGGHQVSRFGNLGGITSSYFGALSGMGIWTNNGYFEGGINSEEGNIGGFTIEETYLSANSGAIVLDTSDNSVTCALSKPTTEQPYIQSQQSTPVTLTTVPRVLALDNGLESTLNLPSSGLPGSGRSTLITIIHAKGTGLGSGKYHINGNGYYINKGGSQVSTFDLTEGTSITLVWDPRQGGQWYEC